MQSLLANKTLLGGLAASVLLILIYFMYFGGEEDPSLVSSGRTSPVSQELLVTLSNLRTIKLDETIFNDPIFTTLSDFGVVIPPEAIGRRNPFAPIGAGGGASAPSQATTTEAISE